eukprot:2845298-Amphidinium_carterae.1
MAEVACSTTLMRPHHKRSSKKIGHLDRNYLIGLRFKGRKPDPGPLFMSRVQFRPHQEPKLRTA